MDAALHCPGNSPGEANEGFTALFAKCVLKGLEWLEGE